MKCLKEIIGRYCIELSADSRSKLLKDVDSWAEELKKKALADHMNLRDTDGDAVIVFKQTEFEEALK